MNEIWKDTARPRCVRDPSDLIRDGSDHPPSTDRRPVGRQKPPVRFLKLNGDKLSIRTAEQPRAIETGEERGWDIGMGAGVLRTRKNSSASGTDGETLLGR